MKEGIPFFGPVPSRNKIPEDGDSRIGQKPDCGTGALKAQLFPGPCVSLFQVSQRTAAQGDSTCEHLLSLPSLSSFPTSSPLVCPAQVSCQNIPITFLPPPITDLSPVLLISQTRLTCVSCFLQKTASLLPAWLEVFWKHFQYNDLGYNILWSRGFQTLEC